MFKIIVALIVAFLPVTTASADQHGDAIRHLLHSTFDKPGSALVVEPVVAVNAHAIAGWSQGDMGGRALLRNRNGAWSLILCSGDGIKSAEALRQAGVPDADAALLAQRLAVAERLLAPERLSLFAKFEGTIMMDSAGHHPAVHQVQMHMPSAQFKVGPIVIDTPWVRATPKGAKVAGGYMKITNTGNEPDRLMGGTLAETQRFEVHEMKMVGDVMQMRPLPNGLEIGPHATVELRPGGLHVMGLGLTGGYQQNTTVKGTLRFEKAGTVEVEYAVAPIGGQAAPMHH